jgi:hypothetical protein
MLSKYKVLSIETGRVFYESASFLELIQIVDIPTSEHMAVITAEIGQELIYNIKPVLSRLKIKVIKIS